MSLDENELRKALEARSGEVTPEYRSRLRQALAEPRPASNWMAAIALVVVTLLTATSVGALIYSRQPRSAGSVASSPRVTPPATSNPTPVGENLELSAPSANVLWALVDYTSLYLSRDQGNHWERRSMPTSSGIRPSISFVDDREGWLLAPGSPATQCQSAGADLFHTADGGTTWTKLQTVGIDARQCKELIYFADRGHGYLTAWDDNHQPTVYWTNDMGVGWKHSTLPDNPIFVTKPGGFTLRVDWMKSLGGTVYLEATGTQSDPTFPTDFIYVSTNGGGTWSWKQKVTPTPLVMVTETRWLQLLAPGRSYESTDGGHGFGQYASDFNGDATSRFVFADSQVGFAYTGGLLQRTLDGGVHWTRVSTPGAAGTGLLPTPSPTEIPMPSDAQISAPSAKVVWALVASGHLFRSTDQGATWRERIWPRYQGGGGPPLISFADETHGWALFPGVPTTECTVQGVQLWRTSDAAASWSLVSIAQYGQVSPNGFGIEQCKEAMYFSDALHGFVAADDLNGVNVYRTSDGGITWTASHVPNPTSYQGARLAVKSIRRFGATVVLNAPGYTFESVDSGATWRYAGSVSDGSLNLAFVTETRWLLIGNDGSGQESTDGGKSWHPWRSDYRDAAGVASTFVFATAQVGYGTVRGGVYRTVDGGAHWKIVKSRWP